MIDSNNLFQFLKLLEELENKDMDLYKTKYYINNLSNNTNTFIVFLDSFY